MAMALLTSPCLHMPQVGWCRYYLQVPPKYLDDNMCRPFATSLIINHPAVGIAYQQEGGIFMWMPETFQ